MVKFKEKKSETLMENSCMFLNLLVKLINYTYKGLSSATNPFGKLVRLLSDDVRSLASMRTKFLT